MNIKKKKPYDSATETNGSIEANVAHFNMTAGTGDCPGEFCATCESLNEETKRYIKRYYIRPQNIICSNKDELLKAIVEIDEEDCTIYTLKNLPDHDDVHLLTNQDIIYYYTDGILYDKNHVKVMDYDISPKHEETRDRIDVAAASDSRFADEYEDRLTYISAKDNDTIKVSGKATESLDTDEERDADYERSWGPADDEEDDNPFNEDFCDINAYGEVLTEGSNEKRSKRFCCICGEPLEGYGNNPEPYKHDGECCDACNLKFVVPARMDSLTKDKEESK